MSDLVSLHLNEAFSPGSTPPPAHTPKHSSSLSKERRHRKSSTCSTSSSSSSSASSSPRNSKATRQSFPHASPSAPTFNATSAASALSCEPSPDEEQWLLHSSRAARLYSAQVTQPPSLLYPSLIEGGLIVDDTLDEDVELFPSPSSLLPLPHSHLPLDLVSSYDQLTFMRYPPDLLSIRLTRYVYAAMGFGQSQWPLKRDPGDGVGVGVWGWGLWLWQSCAAMAYIGGLLLLTLTQWTGAEASQLPLHRRVEAVCFLVSFTSTLLLAHTILTNRLLATRVYYLYRNSPTPSLVVGAVDRSLYGGLITCAVLSSIALHVDHVSALRPAFSAAASPSSLEALLLLRNALFLFCTLVLEVQFIASLTLFTSVLSVHRLRVEQAKAGVQAADCEVEAVEAQVLDIHLAVQDLGHRTGWAMAALFSALIIDGAVRWTELLWSTEGAAPQEQMAGLMRVGFNSVLVLFLGLGVARLNLALTQLQSAVSSFPLLRRVAGHEVVPAQPVARPIACPDQAFEVMGFRITFFTLLVYILLCSPPLLFLLHARTSDSVVEG